MMTMPTRDARSLSKTADSPKVRSALSPRPPDPALPLRRRWALSVALAVGLPLALGWAVQRLGPGPHAPVRIELAFQPFGAPGGLAAAGAGSSRKPGPAVAPGRASAVAAAPPASAPGALAPSAAPAQALVPALPAPVRAEPVAAPALVASAPLVPASLLPPPHPSARVSASAESHVPPGTAPAVSGGRGTGAPGTAGLGLAVGNSAGGVPGTGAAGGSVAPEALDAGFGLAAPVRLPYPVAALASGQAGQARIEMEIEPSGRVARVTVLDETAGWGFGDAARQGYLGARFTPPTVRARPVRVVLRKTIEFQP